MMLLAQINWDISPILFSWKFLSVRWYGALFACAFIVGHQFMNWFFKREKKPLEDLDHLLIYMVAGTIIGARLGHCLFYEPGFYLPRPLDILKIWQGGLASHGAAIGMYLSIFLYARNRKDQSFLWLLDRLSIPVIFGGACVRLGNFFNSEIIGTETSAPWGVVFHNAMQLPAETRLIPRHPAQLYESISYFVVFMVLILLYRFFARSHAAGFLHGAFLVGIFSARFGVEFVKRPQTDFMSALPISMGQLLSIPLICVGIWLIIRACRHPQPQPLEA